MTFVDRRSFAVASLVCLAWTASSRPARADQATVAEKLFQDARAALDAGNLPLACTKFGESQRIEPSPGTLLNLADCHARQGKTATAWGEFRGAVGLARARGRADVEAEAEQRASALEPRLSYVRFRFVERAAATVVRLDADALEAAALDGRVPVDVGVHELVVAAPGRIEHRAQIAVAGEGSTTDVSIPALRLAPADTSGARAGAAPAEAERSSLLPGYVVGGAGLVALGVGAAFGALAASAYSDADSACPAHVHCSASALDSREKAGNRATVANVGVGVGIVATGFGLYWLLTHGEPADAGSAPPVRVDVGRAGLGVEVAHAF
jgi:hypothetical protein